VIEGDFGQQALEAEPAFDGLPALAQVLVDDLDSLTRPAQIDGPSDQGVLPRRGLLVYNDLLGGRLADVDDGGSVEVPGLDLGRAEGISRVVARLGPFLP
jgi:hypothetical protein